MCKKRTEFTHVNVVLSSDIEMNFLIKKTGA